MTIKDFRLERYFGQHEFSAKYLLSSSDCDGFPMQYVLDQATPRELERWEHLTLGYTESEGMVGLREAILQYYSVPSVENVVVASPGELNFATMNVLLRPGDHVVSVSPCYQSLTEVVSAIGCEITHWLPDLTNWQFDVAELATLVRPDTKLIIINFPHNPTGSYLSRQQIDEVVAIARRSDAYLFSDEMYHKLVIGDTPELPPISDLYEKGISLWGTSKTFGLAGLRIGWLVSQDRGFLQKVLAYKDYLSICSNAPSEVLTTIALNHLDAFLRPNLAKIHHNIGLFTAFAKERDLVKNFVPPRAGSAAFVELNITEPSLAWSDSLVEKTGIMTVPAEMFGYDGTCIRVGFGRRNFGEVLERLGEAVGG